MSVVVRQGHALELFRTTPSNYFHCGVTSPPYPWQREYPVDPVLWNYNSDQIGWVGTLGREPSMDCMSWVAFNPPCNTCYVCHIRAIMREVNRTLRPEGTFFLNIGDCRKDSKKFQMRVRNGELLGIPWRVALAVQADGMRLVSAIDLVKICPFPQSMEGWRWERHRLKVGDLKEEAHTGYGKNSGRRDGDSYYGVACNPKVQWEECPGCDECSPNGGYIFMKGNGRPTDATEMLFVFAKSDNYFWHTEGLRVPLAKASYGRAKRFAHLFEETGRRVTDASKYSGSEEEMSSQHSYAGFYANRGDGYNGAGRNTWNWMETVDLEGWLQWMIQENLEDSVNWLEWSPENFKGDHYAAFPSFIPRTAVKAATTPAGCCASCGAPWVPMLRKQPGDRDDSGRTHRTAEQSEGKSPPPEKGWLTSRQVVGYKKTCYCPTFDRARFRVLDPFLGSGTTLLVAQQEKCEAVGFELAESHVSISKSRAGLLEPAGEEANEWLKSLTG